MSHAPPCELPVQLADDDLKTSDGHVALPPVQVSARSHWPAAARQVVPLELNWQVALQQDVAVPFVPEPWSHCSALKFVSIVLSPHVEV